MLLDRRITSSAFIIHELEEECRERNLKWLFKGGKEQSCDTLMDHIEKLRSSELYVHNKEDCSELSKKRGRLNADFCIHVVNVASISRP